MRRPKKAATTQEALEIQDKQEGLPHGWIQWKGTDVCMDVHCSCGVLAHIDGDFIYTIKCGGCGKVYCLSGYIEFIEIQNGLFEDSAVSVVIP